MTVKVPPSAAGTRSPPTISSSVVIVPSRIGPSGVVGAMIALAEPAPRCTRRRGQWQASDVATDVGPGEATKHQVGDLAEVLDNLGVFGMLAEDLVALCTSGFRRVPISQGSDYYLSIQGFTPNQIAYAHTHPDSEEWVVVLRGGGQALVAESPVPLGPGLIIGRAAAHPHGFLSGDEPLQLLSVQLPRPRRARPRGINPARPPTRSTARSPAPAADARDAAATA